MGGVCVWKVSYEIILGVDTATHRLPGSYRCLRDTSTLLRCEFTPVRHRSGTRATRVG